MIKYRTCGMCPGGCKVKVTIENDRIVKVEADRNSEDGRVCMRGALTPEILSGSERITRPMIRTGRKGEGLFRTADWDEALDYAVSLLQGIIEKEGARSLATYQGRGILGTPMAEMLSGPGCFTERLGSPNSFSANSICNTASSFIVPVTTVGTDVSNIHQDIENSEYIFIWGKNPKTDSGPRSQYKEILRAKKRGAVLVVIDPREEGMGKEADLWVPVAPGTDGALALAMLKIIIEENLYDVEFVENYTTGFEELKNYLSTLRIEELLHTCRLSREIVDRLVKIFVSTTKISLVSFTGIEYQLSAIQNGRAIVTLFAITGKLDVEGGMYFDREKIPEFRMKNKINEQGLVGEEEFPVFCKFTGKGQFSCFPDAVSEERPYPIKGLIISGGSPILTYPDSGRWAETYKKLDALIIFDRYKTEDVAYADVVFPADTFFETWTVGRDADGSPKLEKPAVSPAGECRNEVMVLMELGRRLGIKDYPVDEEEFKEWLCNFEKAKIERHSGKLKERKYLKYADGSLRADGKKGFPTPSGKFEICSGFLKENGFVSYPEYKDIYSAMGTDPSEYPFLLTTGARSMNRMGVFGANVPQIAKAERSPFMDISPSDALELDIKEGEYVNVISPFGEGRYKAHISRMADHTIHIPHGSGSRYMFGDWKEENVNDLFSLRYHDPISGFVTIKSLPCRVVKQTGV